jgi:hypothetical protein
MGGRCSEWECIERERKGKGGGRTIREESIEQGCKHKVENQRETRRGITPKECLTNILN